MRRHQLLIKKFLRCCVAACESGENYLGSFNLFNSSSSTNNNQLIIINECDHRNVGYICRTQQTHSAIQQKDIAAEPKSLLLCFPSSTYIFSRYPSSFDVVPLLPSCELSVSSTKSILFSLSCWNQLERSVLYVVLFLRWNFNELKLFKTLSSSWDAYKVCNPTTSNMHNKREKLGVVSRVLGKAAMAMKKKANFSDGIKSGGEELGQIKVQAQHKSFRNWNMMWAATRKLRSVKRLNIGPARGEVGGSMEKRHKNN